MWAFDVVGPLEDVYGETKKVSFILTATDYFTKWAEAEAYPIIKANTLVNFIMRNVITRFGIPEQLITDNGPQFISQGLQDLCNKYGIKLNHSTPYYPQGNGQAESTNKTLISIIKKTTENVRASDWPEKLIEALWAYRTSIRTPTGQTPYALTYGMEAVVPYELMIPSLRITLNSQLADEDRRQALLSQLELLDEKRLQAANHVQVYQKRISRAYQKKVIERRFSIGDLVLKRIMVKPGGPRSKLRPNWEGPFVVSGIFPGNAYQLVSQDGDPLPNPWNAMYLKKYYA
jgi:hypothetical protein